jgi:hypothetical protein
MEYFSMVKNVPTRWLSFSKALDRVIQSWPAIKLYFLNKGEERCNKYIWKFVKGQEDDMAESILILEMENFSPTEIHEIFLNLKNKLEGRVRDRFLSFKVNTTLTKLPEDQHNKFTSEAIRANILK